MSTVFYAGDSTVAVNKIDTYPQTGMAQALPLFLKDSVRVRSLAANGRSTRSFIEDGRLDIIEEEIQEGDFLFIQFGHNDEKEDPKRHTDPDSSFKDYLRRYIDTARRHGATPVLISSIARRLFDEEGNFLPGSHGAYPKAMMELGKEMSVVTVDLCTITEQYLSAVGDLASKPLFMWPQDNTHLKPEGAVVMAELLTKELRKLGSPFDSILYRPEDSVIYSGDPSL